MYMTVGCSHVRDFNTYLHDESFQGDPFVVVGVIVVELEVVVEDEGGLHVEGHLQPHRAGS